MDQKRFFSCTPKTILFLCTKNDSFPVDQIPQKVFFLLHLKLDFLFFPGNHYLSFFKKILILSLIFFPPPYLCSFQTVSSLTRALSIYLMKHLTFYPSLDTLMHSFVLSLSFHPSLFILFFSCPFRFLLLSPIDFESHQEPGKERT